MTQQAAKMWQNPLGRCRAYIFPVVMNFPIDVCAHICNECKIINVQQNLKTFLVSMPWAVC